MGSSTTASGFNSLATGNSTTASGQNSTAMGGGTTASGQNSTALGSYNTASAYASTAIGSNTIASGYNSTVMGQNTTAKSYNETTIGSFNTDYTPSSTEAFVSTDRLFVIGNGERNAQRDALVMLKNGNTTFSGAVTAASVTQSSDLRLKRNIAPLQNSLDAIMNLKPVSYEKKSSLASKDYSIKENGFIAQEIKKVFPNLVVEGSDKDNLLSVNYTALIPVLTKAIQEQQQQLLTQQNEIAELKKMVELLLKK
jgi:hypothetical protein